MRNPVIRFAISLAIFVALFRHTETIDVNEIHLLKW